MKICLICNKGKLVEEEVDYSVFGISLGRFAAEVCTQCDEAYFDENVAKEIERREKERGYRIPQKIAKILHLKEGREVIITS